MNVCANDNDPSDVHKAHARECVTSETCVEMLGGAVFFGVQVTPPKIYPADFIELLSF